MLSSLVVFYFPSPGGTASGKTTVCDEICTHLGGRVALLQMDRFYNTLPHDKPATAHNFDVPDAFDWPLFVDTLQKLSTGQSVQVPRYSFETHQRLKELDTFEGAEVILVEGILTLHDPRVTPHNNTHMLSRTLEEAVDSARCPPCALFAQCHQLTSPRHAVVSVSFRSAISSISRCTLRPMQMCVWRDEVRTALAQPAPAAHCTALGRAAIAPPEPRRTMVGNSDARFASHCRRHCARVQSSAILRSAVDRWTASSGSIWTP